MGGIAVLIISERTSNVFAVLKTTQKRTRKEMKEAGEKWISQYIKENGYNYNPFYSVVTSEKSAPKNVRTITI